MKYIGMFWNLNYKGKRYIELCLCVLEQYGDRRMELTVGEYIEETEWLIQLAKEQEE